MEKLVIGQIVEFLVWAQLAAGSAGRLHVFLPLWDRGIDGLIHRRTDGAYIPVQVKGKSVAAREGWVHVVVRKESLRDDRALLVCPLLDGDHLASRVMVVQEGAFKQLAGTSLAVDGAPVYDAAFRLDGGRNSRWAPFIVPLEALASRFGIDSETPTMVAERPPRHPADRHLGVVGEAEVIRRLAGMVELSIFRPFPDLETAEIAVRHEETFRALGIQVKTVSVPDVHTETTVDIQEASFEAASSTWFTILTWLRDEQQFHPEFLLIPSEKIRDLSHLEGITLQISFTPGSTRHALVEPYRCPLEDLGMEIAGLLA